MSQEVTIKLHSNTKRTNTDNQSLILKQKIKDFFLLHLRGKEKHCPIKDILATNLDKWSLFVLYNLSYSQIMRFNELKTRINGISSRMLSITLKKLEKNGVIKRTVFPEIPPKVEYELTSFGREFSVKIIEMSQWYIESYPRELEQPSVTA